MPTATHFSPKQVANALGVSESSVKRWVDSGKLPAAKTVGGHRKVTLPSVAQFIRETGHEVARPDLLGMVAAPRQASLESVQDELYQGLIRGQEADCRELLLGFYQRGESVVEIGDRLVGPVLKRVGDGWEAGEVAVFEERRSCEVLMAVLHEIRRWIPTPADDARLALVATPHSDFAEVPARLVELVLLSAGWRVVAAGSGLPPEEIQRAILRHKPRLVCVSASHLESPERFATEYKTVIVKPTAEAAEEDSDWPGVAHAVGGFALREIPESDLGCDLLARDLGALAGFQGEL